MKKILFIIVTLFISINVYAIDFNLSSKGAYVYNLSENKVMYEKNADKQIKIASMTKIMTAILVIENNDLNDVVEIKESDFKDYPEYVAVGFKVGDKVTVNDLLYGILLKSGSDAVNAAVRKTAGEEKFVNMMNSKAKELNLANTHFSNPIGKDDGNYSTLKDVEKLMEYCLKNDTFKKVVTTPKYKVNGIEIEGPVSYLNQNYISGAKSGFTDEAGRCLVSFSDKTDVTYIVVTNNADTYENLFKDNNSIYEYLINNYGYINYKVNFDIKIKRGKEKYYTVNYNNKYYLEKNYDKSKLTYKYDGVDEITRKIKKGDKLGILKIYYDNKLLDTKDIILDKKIKYKFNFLLILIPLILIFIIIKKKKR